MEELYRNAFSEVFYILNNLQIKSKIPDSFVNFIQINRNFDYNPNFPDDIIFHPEKLKPETRAILSLLYRNYLCSKEEKIQLLKSDEEEIRKEYEIFNQNNNVKNEPFKVENTNKENMQLVDTSKMNFFKRLFLKIKNFFKRGK